MKKPSLEEVKEYFKDAETIECAIGASIKIKKDTFHKYTDGFFWYTDENGYHAIVWDGKYAKILTYKESKEETFLISKEQIESLRCVMNISSCDNGISFLKEWFPSALVDDKKELVLEVGKWYKSGDTIFNHQEAGNSYGVLRGKWQQNNWITRKEYLSCPILEMTPEEVKESLTKEAMKRGFKEGVYYKFPNSGSIFICSNEITLNEKNYQILYFGDHAIFHNGEWAEIIPTITKSEAEQKLNCKII